MAKSRFLHLFDTHGTDGLPFDGIAFLCRSYLAGALVGVVLGVGLLAIDAGGLRTLALGDPLGPIAAVLLVFVLSLTFAALYAATAIMLEFRGRAIERDEPDEPPQPKG